MRLLSLLLVVGLIVAVAACDREPDLSPPEGWETDGDARWWRSDVDTSIAFRNLESFEDMGLSEREDGLREESAAVRNVQRRLLPLYRNHPEVVDSVFAETAVPMIEREATTGPDTEERDELVRRVNRRVHRLFFPAQPRPRQYDPIVRPDSLREAGVSGTIALQLYLDEQGRPLAIERLEGVHPTMDALVMRNYADRTWQPAHLSGEPIASWIRTSLTLGQ